MGSKNSNKSIWTMFSGTVLQINPGVLENELESCKTVLSTGVLYYKPNSADSEKKFNSSKDVPESWKDFVSKVSKTLGVEEMLCWDLICSYLSTEFRGTQETLKELIKDEQKKKPLILDIWQFYRAERLYLLQILKQILTQNQDSKTSPIIKKALKLLDSGQGLRKSLMEQIKSVTKEKAPITELLGPSLGRNCRSSWIHYNLRETCELLQILLISLHVNGFQYADISDITEIFFQFGFGTKLPFKSEFDETNNNLVRNIIHLCVMTLVFMMDLPSLSTSVEDHKIWGTSENVSKLERLVSGLGNHPSHSPVLLAWTLSCFLARGPDGLGKSSRLGEIALANRVLKTLETILTDDFNSHHLVSDIIHLEVYTVVSVLLSVFDPVSMGLQTEISNLANILLKHKSVAAHFWKQGSESGLAFYFQEILHNFPREFIPTVECMSSLSEASEVSSQKTVAALASLDIYTENVDEISSRIGRSSDGGILLLEDRYPYKSTRTICIPANTKGELGENGCVKWRMKYSGWQLLLAECGELNLEVSLGEEQVRARTLNRVTKLTDLVSNLISTSPDMVGKLEELVRELGILCERFCQVSHPPVNLLAGITRIFASLIKTKKCDKMLKMLKSSGLLPHYSFSHSLLEKSSSTLVPGVVGLLLAEEETVCGEYPLLIAFLSLLKESYRSEDCQAEVLFVCREVLPSFSNWRYQIPGQREQILKLSLSTLLQFINDVDTGPELLSREHSVCGSLLYLVSTGDRTIQTLLENQVSWEKGRGTDFCEIVETSLKILDSLLSSSSAEVVLAGPVGAALRAPPSGPQAHLILSLAHYSYFFHDPAVATAAISLLGTVATAVDRAKAAVSLLGCLGSSAVSVKDLLLARLESPLEDIRLKIAIVDLLSQCVNTQPGMMQLLLDININLTVVSSEGSEAVEKESGDSKLVGEGCLTPTLQLLALCRDKKDDNWQKLHLSIVKLIYNLWDSTSLLATRHLKDEPNFWTNLCWPISDPIENPDHRHIKAKAYILRILASEIYTWKGKVADELSKVLEKICSEESTCMENWCQGNIPNKLPEKTLHDEDDDTEDPENVEMFLISSWRIFLLVLSKDYPVCVSLAACRLTFMATVRKLMEVLRDEPPPVRLSVLLAETGTVLIKRWQTKSTDDMESLCKDMAGILEILYSTWTSLHPRARLSILGLALSTLRVSQFKLDSDQENRVFKDWMSPAVRILSLSFRDVESSLGRKDGPVNVHLAPELTISLLQTLISRFTQDKIWLSELHKESALQLLLSAAGTCCRHKAAPTFVSRILQLLIGVAAVPSGSATLLLHELAQELWLPLADLPDVPEWEEASLLGLELGSALLRTGRTYALKTAITAMALLSDKLVRDLMKPRNNLSGLPRTVCIARFVGLLSNHINTWRFEHQPSLLVIYRCCCVLLHYCTALLMRPVLLASLVKVSQGVGSSEDANRCRRISTASCSEVEVESVPPEAAAAHGSILDISLSCLSLLLALSPSLPSLLTGDALLDPEGFEPLLSVSFSNPTMEENQEQLSYGTLLALANCCIKGITRDHARSPSPGRGAAKPSSPETPDKRKQTLVMERCLVLILCQSILTLSHSSMSSRDKQLLRRELGAELGSIADTWRRYHIRGGKSPGPTRSVRFAGTPSRGRSPQPPPSPQPPKTKSCGEDQFMKFVSSLVGNIFK